MGERGVRWGGDEGERGWVDMQTRSLTPSLIPSPTNSLTDSLTDYLTHSPGASGHGGEIHPTVVGGVEGSIHWHTHIATTHITTSRTTTTTRITSSRIAISIGRLEPRTSCLDAC